MTIRPIVDGQAGLPSPSPSRSYWHREPSSVLLGHRTTEELPERADVVIVGSGITGTFAARSLLEDDAGREGGGARRSVVMFEAREACWGATGRNGGHCQPFVYPADSETAEFELKTYRFLRDLVAENKISCDWRSLMGVHAFLTEEVFEVAIKAVEQLKKRDPGLASDITVVSPTTSGSSVASIGTQGPTLTSLRIPDAKGAIVQRNAASLWPYKLVCWVLEQLLSQHSSRSFNLQTNTPVTGLQPQTVSSETGGSADGYTWVVRTPRGRIAARHVLLATNGYTSHLLPAFADLIVPVRGQIGALLPPSPPEPPVGLDHSYVFFGEYATPDGPPVTRDEYLVQRPLPTGELIYGGGRNCARETGVGEWRDDEVEGTVATFLRRQLSPMLELGRPDPSDTTQGVRDAQELKASFEWTGVMGFSRDDAPWVGAVPESMGGGPGLWLCAAYTGHGMPLAALCARAVADMIVDKPSSGMSGMPSRFVLTEERVLRAQTMDTVKARGEKGLVADFAHMFAIAEGTHIGQS